MLEVGTEEGMSDMLNSYLHIAICLANNRIGRWIYTRRTLLGGCMPLVTGAGSVCAMDGGEVTVTSPIVKDVDIFRRMSRNIMDYHIPGSH
jgi:hypothetical protein